MSIRMLNPPEKVVVVSNFTSTLDAIEVVDFLFSISSSFVYPAYVVIFVVIELLIIKLSALCGTNDVLLLKIAFC